MSKSLENKGQPQGGIETTPGSGAEERRQIIIEIIVQHFLSGKKRKLKLVELAKRAGISRQALDRYYGDLKPYISGEKDITQLANSEEDKLQMQIQNSVGQVELGHAAEVERLEKAHRAILKETLERHITTLMNDDLAIHHSHTIRTSLEKQTLHNDKLKKQLAAAELQIALGATSRAPASKGSQNENHKLIFNVDIEGICTKLGRKPDIDDLEDAKDEEIRKIREKLNTFSTVDNVRVVIFSERYLSRFSTFAENFEGSEHETTLIVRLPLFSRNEILNFIKHLPKQFKISVYVPYCPSEFEKRAQREFMFRNLASEEAKSADNADAINISWGFDEVIHFKINQGD
ncbi:helix-turn-helix domain-containing protein [Pseudomonas putida]|uniref:helix-turn-helix domain-containing protein n=1 Tax=Pseudomonas putida TaxID=303 RepID=UPI003305C5BC